MKIITKFMNTNACAVCGAQLRRVLSLQHATTRVLYCSRACRHRRHKVTR